ncbi:MAG: thioesterase family protein [Chitinophagaceae bacterium]|nr:thioesterase family protein [Chitinophagaceae bacterium]
MELFTKEVQVRWSDLDPNVHLRHSVYYDWGAFCRIEFFQAYGLTTELMQQLHFGPILFREECVFRKEIRLGDKVTISIKLVKSKRDFSRWTIQHNIMKNGDVLSAVLTVDGAWLNTAERKLATPPVKVAEVFSQIPVDNDFQWLD